MNGFPLCGVWHLGKEGGDSRGKASCREGGKVQRSGEVVDIGKRKGVEYFQFL